MSCAYERYLGFFRVARATVEAGDERAFHALQDQLASLDGTSSAAAWLARRDALVADAPRERAEACAILGCCEAERRRDDDRDTDGRAIQAPAGGD